MNINEGEIVFEYFNHRNLPGVVEKEKQILTGEEEKYGKFLEFEDPEIVLRLKVLGTLGMYELVMKILCEKELQKRTGLTKDSMQTMVDGYLPWNGKQLTKKRIDRKIKTIGHFLAGDDPGLKQMVTVLLEEK